MMGDVIEEVRIDVIDVDLELHLKINQKENHMAVRIAYALVSNGKLWVDQCANKGQYMIYNDPEIAESKKFGTVKVAKVKIEIVEG